ncbi:MAG: putative membrane protein [Rhodobacteraceae bacterium HLUCCO07]|nr:MAG: putative membrane protein [Rhodobacteraceae bacterium HLUCCO07]
MNTSVVFIPLLPWPIIAVLALITAVLLGLAVWRGLSGWVFRLLGAAVLILALLSPRIQQEERQALNDIAIVVVDNSASQTLGDRAGQSETAFEELETRLSNLGDTEIRRVDVDDGEGDSGTRLMTALTRALNKEPRSRISGVFLISDGRIHDVENAPDLSAPMHLLLTGEPSDWDRQIVVEDAPAFAILDEEVTLTVRVEDSGAVPDDASVAPLEVSVDGEPPVSLDVPVGRSVDIPIQINHTGRNVFQISTPETEGELTARNNIALVQVNGVRDRLRVLLVSGEPHPGSRTWRNLLKSDSSVDLVHFTILRPPEKQDGVPVGELSLIAFPTRELFIEKIDDFDLIIFDRYKRRGILPSVYLDNVRQYVEGGGAVLVAAGPDFASADSIFRSPLSEVLPASPTARVIERGYRPKVSELGKRHPVTSNLDASDQPADWGRWMRQIEVTPVEERDGHVVMDGHEGAPLLVLDRVGEGRIALLASDHAWLWNRGFEGGGPQLDLLRRLSHWMMKEPELEEEDLVAEPDGKNIKITRRTLADTAAPVTVTSPDGESSEHRLVESTPGVFEGTAEGDEIGLYRLSDDEKSALVGLGPVSPREFVDSVAGPDWIEPVLEAHRGGSKRLSEGMPTIRTVKTGRPATGRGWLGITPRAAYDVTDMKTRALLPAWLSLLLAAGLLILAWLREGRR